MALMVRVDAIEALNHVHTGSTLEHTVPAGVRMSENRTATTMKTTILKSDKYHQE